jgi:hypothetical protein
MTKEIELAKQHGIQYRLTPEGTTEMWCHDRDLQAFAEALVAAERARARDRQPLNDAQALELARAHLDRGLSWAPHIVRCTDLEVRSLIRAVEAAHGIGA